MNNKGQTAMLAVLFAIMFFLFGVVFVNYIRPEVQNTQSSLSCNDISISDGTKLMCLFTDSVVPYFIILVLSAAGGVITSRLAI